MTGPATGQTAQMTCETMVTIQNRLGLHARPAMAFVDVANGFAADIRVNKGSQDVDGKSIMQMMMLAATQGTDIRIEARGNDAGEAIKTLCKLVEGRFGED